MKSIATTIAEYNRLQKGEDKAICTILKKEISSVIPKAKGKIWHGGPVWFLEENPIVGYEKLKDGVRLLFWSGQTFKTKGLSKEGSFKAAEARYGEREDIKLALLRRWLRESKTVQWDYKNIVKRKGKLVRL